MSKYGGSIVPPCTPGFDGPAMSTSTFTTTNALKRRLKNFKGLKATQSQVVYSCWFELNPEPEVTID